MELTVLRWAVLDRGMDISESRDSMQLEKSRPRGTSSQVLSFLSSPSPTPIYPGPVKSVNVADDTAE